MAAGARQDGIDTVSGDVDGGTGTNGLTGNGAPEPNGRSSAEEWLPAALVPYDHETDEQGPDPEPEADAAQPDVEPAVEEPAVEEPDDDRATEAEARAAEAEARAIEAEARADEAEQRASQLSGRSSDAESYEDELAARAAHAEARADEFETRGGHLAAKVTELTELLDSQRAELEEMRMALATAVQLAPEPRPEPPAAPTTRVLDLNEVSFDRLCRLSVPAEQAAYLIDAREQRGGFSSPNELDELEGLPPETVAALKHAAGA